MHGSESDIQTWWPSVENVGHTAVRHLYIDNDVIASVDDFLQQQELQDELFYTVHVWNTEAAETTEYEQSCIHVRGDYVEK